MTAGADTDTLVLREIEDGVAVLSFNRPERANSWSVPMEAAVLPRCCSECERGSRCAGHRRHRRRQDVLSGNGCEHPVGPGQRRCRFDVPAQAPTDHLPRTIRKPIIAAINGACAGIGLIVAMNCDLRFTTDPGQDHHVVQPARHHGRARSRLVAAPRRRSVHGAGSALLGPGRAGRRSPQPGPGGPGVRARDIDGRNARLRAQPRPQLLAPRDGRHQAAGVRGV